MGDILIHPPLKIRKLSLESILTDPAQTYLIGNKDKSSILCRKTVELILGYVEHSIYILPISRKKKFVSQRVTQSISTTRPLTS